MGLQRRQKFLFFVFLVFTHSASQLKLTEKNASSVDDENDPDGKQQPAYGEENIGRVVQEVPLTVHHKGFMSEVKTYLHSEAHQKVLPSKRDAKKDVFFALRKHMNEEKKQKTDAVAESRIAPNFTLPHHIKTVSDMHDISLEQAYNKNNNKLRQLYNLHNSEREMGYIKPGFECDFEGICNWKWKNEEDGLVVRTAGQFSNSEGPEHDANNHYSGHFLVVLGKHVIREYHVVSADFQSSGAGCRLEIWTYHGIRGGVVKVIANTTQQVMVGEVNYDNSRSWKKHVFNIGTKSEPFNIIIEVIPQLAPSFIALDNIKLSKCFPEASNDKLCTPYQFQCVATKTCINNTKVCDITLDCDGGEDEIQNCDKIPYGARCDFEDDWCGWHNAENQILQWSRHNGSTPTNRTGPNYDHTYQNSTGKYLFVNMAQSIMNNAGFASTANLNSVIFNPPPRVHGNISSQYYNSCMIRFYYHQYGIHKSGIGLTVTELKPNENVTTQMWWSFADLGDVWRRRDIILPNITYRYFLQFDAKKGIRILSDVAIDDFSMSPECFGLNIPASELNGYNYWNPQFLDRSMRKTHRDFVNQTYYKFTSCGVKGRDGPRQTDCVRAYNGTEVRVQVVNESGVVLQKWTTPQEGFYTMILVGASGGKGSSGMGSSRGAMVRTVLELRKGQDLYFLVGQEGTSACLKSLYKSENSSCVSPNNGLTGIRAILTTKLLDGGGGGGGATFVLLMNRTRHAIPLAVAAGGGGLGIVKYIDNGIQHGQGINISRSPVTGNMYSNESAGAGGGWFMHRGALPAGEDITDRLGHPLVQGARGGKACYYSSDGRGDGGFGGGGGGCISGGGGGGYAGGNAESTNGSNGEGGFSFLDRRRAIPDLSAVSGDYHSGPGTVLIIPAVSGCGCDYRCLALDMRMSRVACICPKSWRLGEDGRSCIKLPDADRNLSILTIILLVVIAVLVCAFLVICTLLYNRYQQSASGLLRRKMLTGPDLQLNRIRVASDSMMTEYNPNYEFGGVVYTLKDLKDIPREQLRLLKALGQGAFGEVYQGFYRQRAGDAVEMPVAVKTLPEMSTNQAEMDFLMEALIMSKFSHPNIVHFIGVCFDKHPRFIVLELLAGGDLKNFLREARPKPERSSCLTMKDLVLMAIDIAKGCKYMEDNRFIHRDIAARNCLLTTKGPGRVVKIADFGMSRDIYRSDYYRKGGKAMLPIKWMPPEAFLDGIFTSKTDVWSFGVLLWEIMSMGYMPYTGCANREVMQLVTSGGRLEPPASCPSPIYAIMTQCWHPNPEQRPTFGLILERLGYCAQDPNVMSVVLPVFNRLPSHERDTTVMRPEISDESYLKVPHTTEYLIPTARNQSDLQTCISTSSVDTLLTNDWETSFAMPHSKSTQPLLSESEQNTENENGNNSTASPQTPASPPVCNNNHNNNKTDSNIKSGLSLDASALVKQTSITKKKTYANINAGSESVMSNGVIQNGPYTIQSQPNSVYVNNTVLASDTEINC